MEKRLLVIQEHDAIRAKKHWDVRFESSGDLDIYSEKTELGSKLISKEKRVLRSFVIPKCEFPEKGKFKLVIKVEDHPWEYKDFKGTIKSGYGAGKVKLLFCDYINVYEFSDSKIIFEFDKEKYTIFKAKDIYLIRKH